MEIKRTYEIIDEYIGYSIKKNCLTALVPVWDKLNVFDLKFSYIGKDWDAIGIRVELETYDFLKKDYSLQEAAAIATAKAIQELK